MQRPAHAIVSMLPLDVVGGGEVFTLNTHRAALRDPAGADLWCATTPHTATAPQPTRLAHRYRRLARVDGAHTVAEETSLDELLRRLAGCETVVIHQHLASLATVDILAAASPWQRHVLTSLGAEGQATLVWRSFEPHAGVSVAEISRYAAERSSLRGIPATAVSAGLWTTDFREPPPKTGSGPLRAVSVGRILPHKCFEVAVEAVGREHELTIVGPDSGDDDYQRFIATRAAAARCVRRTGYVDDATRTALVAAADVLIASSSHVTYTGHTLDQAELFGLVILEAVAVGTLPLVSDIPSFREIMEDLGLGDWIYPQRDAAALAALLARVRCLPPDARLERVADARSRAERLFLWDTYWQRLLEATASRPTADRIPVS
jgi:glycosyltransferase involved in cell wall biosynthesis